jgi:hypothetical protein
MTAPVSLDEARRARARCACGSGVFRRDREAGGWRCFDCGLPKSAPPIGAMPRLTPRCACGSCLFVVGVGGLRCAICREANALTDLTRGLH